VTDGLTAPDRVPKTKLRGVAEWCGVLALVFAFATAGKITKFVWFGPIGVLSASAVAWYLEGGGIAGLSRLGLSRPRSWTVTILLAVVTAVVGQLAVSLLSPLVLSWWGTPDFSAIGKLRGHPWALAKWLLVIWTGAAFGEEIVFRGFLIRRFADAYGNTRRAQASAIAVSAAFFGLAHSYQGPSGAILAGVIALVYGTSYVQARGNLWRTILAHGLYDSTAFILAFLSGSLK